MLHVPYSNLSLLFGPLKWAQIIYNIFYLLKRPEGRTVGALVYAHLLWLGSWHPWWGLEFVEMTSHHVLCFFFLRHLHSYLVCITPKILILIASPTLRIIIVVGEATLPSLIYPCNLPQLQMNCFDRTITIGMITSTKIKPYWMTLALIWLHIM